MLRPDGRCSWCLNLRTIGSNFVDNKRGAKPWAGEPRCCHCTR
jgi:hypothetical protein